MVPLWPKHTRPEWRMSSSRRPMPIYSTMADTIWMPRSLLHKINWPMASSSSAMELVWITPTSTDMVHPWRTATSQESASNSAWTDVLISGHRPIVLLPWTSRDRRASGRVVRLPTRSQTLVLAWDFPTTSVKYYPGIDVETNLFKTK